MTDHHQHTPESPSRIHLQAYFVGFSLSLLLTILSFNLALTSSLPASTLSVFITILAIFQLFAQFHFFLQIGSGTQGQWQKIALLLAIFFSVIVVGGTLWIMNNLQHESDSQINKMFMNGLINTHDMQD